MISELQKVNKCVESSFKNIFCQNISGYRGGVVVSVLACRSEGPWVKYISNKPALGQPGLRK